MSILQCTDHLKVNIRKPSSRKRRVDIFFYLLSAFGHISLALLIVHSILQNPTMSLSLYDIRQFSFTSLKVVYQMESIRIQSVFKLVRLAALACVVIRIAFIKARGFGCSCFISYNIVSQICFCFCRKMNWWTIEKIAGIFVPPTIVSEEKTNQSKRALKLR